jgi:nucleoside-diphosphate-sugar epimerase
MRIVITGGFGFLGRQVAAALLKARPRAVHRTVDAFEDAEGPEGDVLAEAAPDRDQ